MVKTAVTWLSAIATIILIASILLATLGRTLLNSKISEAVVIDSKDHPDYQSFHTNSQPDAPVKLNTFYFYHIKNPNEFIYNQTPPHFEERGPYVFREYYKRQNTTFSADGTEVSFTEAIVNKFVPELSNGTAEDRLTIINLPYLKVSSRFSSESQMLSVVTAYAIPRIIEELEMKMIPGIKAAGASTVITLLTKALAPMNGLMDNLLIKMGGGCAGKFGCKIVGPFADLVDPKLCNRDGAIRQDCGNDTIPLQTMKRLMNASDLYSPLNDTQDFGATLWMTSANSSLLTGHFAISRRQFKRIHNWIFRVAESQLLKDQIFKQLNGGIGGRMFPVSKWKDLALRQWLRADVISTLRKLSKPLSVQPEAPPEFFFSLPSPVEDINRLHWDASVVECIADNMQSNKTWVMEGLFGFSYPRPGKRHDFLRADLEDHRPTRLLRQCLQPDYEKAVQLLKRYFDYSARHTFTRQLFLDAFQAGSGLLMTRTVHQHVLGSGEPLLMAILEPSDPRHQSYALQVNDKTLEQVPDCHSAADLDNDYTSCELVTDGTHKRYRKPPSVFYTGKGDLRRIGQFKSLNGYTLIDKVFTGGVMPIDGAADHLPNSIQYGYSDLLQFPPLGAVNGGGTMLYAFIPAITAPVCFTAAGETVDDLFGIEMRRFRLAPENFESAQRFDAHLFQNYTHTNSLESLNLQDSKQLALFISRPRFYGTQKSFRVDHLPDYSDNSQLESFLDVEPLTGKAMRVQIHVQISVSTNITNYDLFHPNVFKDDFLPVFRKRVSGQVDEKSAERFKSTAQFATAFIEYGTIVGVAVSVVLLITAALLHYIIAYRQHSQQQADVEYMPVKTGKHADELIDEEVQ